MLFNISIPWRCFFLFIFLGFYAEPVRWKDGVIPATESLPADRQQPQLDAEVHFLLSVGQPVGLVRGSLSEFEPSVLNIHLSVTKR